MQYNEGDLVEAVRGERRVIDRVQVNSDSGNLWIPGVGYILNIGPDGRLFDYALTVIEKAVLKLPTEPGLYLASSMIGVGPWVFRLDDRGDWTLLNTNSPFRIGDGQLESNAPFTRLEPAPVTAKKVLDRVRELYVSTTPRRFASDCINVAAAEFGVTQ